MPFCPKDFLPPAKGFLGLAPEQAKPLEEARVCVIPFGLEHTVSYGGGTAKGPEAILRASHQVELFDEELWCEPHTQVGIQTLRPVRIKKHTKAALRQIEDLVEQAVAAGQFPLVLGGEHSVTAGAIRPLVRRHPQLTLLHFDAHADLRADYEGDPWSHASALRRCLDHPGVRLVSVGIRNISAGEVPFYEAERADGEGAQGRIHIFWAKDRAMWRQEEILKALGPGPVYITFDVDAFDSSLMAATGTPEPGGLYWDDVIPLLRAAAAQSRVVGADVMELAPRPELRACAFLAAKLCFKILGAVFCQGRPSPPSLPHPTPR
jgi:agmatinase